MSLKQLLSDSRIKAEATSKTEIEELRRMTDSNLSDAQIAGLSAQGKFEFAYNAGRHIATMVIRASGYRVSSKMGHHYYTFAALLAMDAQFDAIAGYFNQCREKRNDFSYDSPVIVTDTEADDILATAAKFRLDFEKWLQNKHPELV